MGKLGYAIAALAVGVGTGVGVAGPAAADDPAPEGTVEGVYTFGRDGQTATWKITPLCAPTVGDGRIPLNLAVGCKLQVESDGIAGQSGLYRMVGGAWTYSKPLLAGKTCPDGRSAPTQETYQFDTSLTGTYSQSHNAVCGDQPGIDRHPFTLTFVSPLPNPPVRYPLHCQDNPVHLCS